MAWEWHGPWKGAAIAFWREREYSCNGWMLCCVSRLQHKRTVPSLFIFLFRCSHNQSRVKQPSSLPPKRVPNPKAQARCFLVCFSPELVTLVWMATIWAGVASAIIQDNFAPSEVPGGVPQLLDYNFKTSSYHYSKSIYSPTTISSNCLGFSGLIQVTLCPALDHRNLWDYLLMKTDTSIYTWVNNVSHPRIF